MANASFSDRCEALAFDIITCLISQGDLTAPQTQAALTDYLYERLRGVTNLSARRRTVRSSEEASK